MHLDFIDNINEYGDNVVRLYDFDMAESIKFRQLIIDVILKEQMHLDLSTVDFIELRNCNLTLIIGEEDEGILTVDKQNFFCFLTIQGYENIVKLLNPFCEKETKGYKMLYDIDSLTDFLFSPAGTW